MLKEIKNQQYALLLPLKQKETSDRLGRRPDTRRLAIAAALSVGLLSIGLSASAQTGPAVTAEDMTLGSANAPVTMVEYGSAACSHCAAWAKDVYPAFKAKYIDTGKVRYVFREFITAPPQLAAAGFLLARCAGKDKYFGVLDQVFHAQEEIFRTGDIRGPLVAIAAQAGMNEQQLNACVGDEKELNALNARVEKWATTAKITGTPTLIFADGSRVPGAINAQQVEKAARDAGHDVAGACAHGTLVAKIIGKAVRDGKLCYYINDGVYGSFNCILFDHQKVTPNVLLTKGGPAARVPPASPRGCGR